MLYSVRMRAAQGGAHEKGGRHISGAERIVTAAKVKDLLNEMFDRALYHSRGRADFINFTVEQVFPERVKTVELLDIHTMSAADMKEARRFAYTKLQEAGVAEKAIISAFYFLDGLKESMRGAMLVDAISGERLDAGMRGVRVSRMDAADDQALAEYLKRRNGDSLHAREAVVLASKVISAPNVLAELCWSDDPEYTTGYVSSKICYTRITNLKEVGSDIGGRVFFVESNADVRQIRDYLEETAVLVTVPEGGK